MVAADVRLAAAIRAEYPPRPGSRPRPTSARTACTAPATTAASTGRTCRRCCSRPPTCGTPAEAARLEQARCAPADRARHRARACPLPRGMTPLRLTLEDDLDPFVAALAAGRVDGPADRHGLRARVRRASAGRVRADAAHQGARPDEADEHHRRLARHRVRDRPARAAGACRRARASGCCPVPVTVVVPNPGRRFRWLCGPDPSRIGLRVPVLPPSIAAGHRPDRCDRRNVGEPAGRAGSELPRRGAGGDPLEGRGGDRRRADADRQALHGRRSDRAAIPWCCARARCPSRTVTRSSSSGHAPDGVLAQTAEDIRAA